MVTIQVLRDRTTGENRIRIVANEGANRPQHDNSLLLCNDLVSETVIENANMVDVDLITENGTLSTSHNFCEYPNADTEFIRNRNKGIELTTSPRTRIELQSDDDGNKALYTYIWADPDQEDYTDKIRMDNF